MKIPVERQTLGAVSFIIVDIDPVEKRAGQCVGSDPDGDHGGAAGGDSVSGGGRHGAVAGAYEFLQGQRRCAGIVEREALGHRIACADRSHSHHGVLTERFVCFWRGFVAPRDNPAVQVPDLGVEGRIAYSRHAAVGVEQQRVGRLVGRQRVDGCERSGAIHSHRVHEVVAAQRVAGLGGVGALEYHHEADVAPGDGLEGVDHFVPYRQLHAARSASGGVDVAHHREVCARLEANRSVENPRLQPLGHGDLPAHEGRHRLALLGMTVASRERKERGCQRQTE